MPARKIIKHMCDDSNVLIVAGHMCYKQNNLPGVFSL